MGLVLEEAVLMCYSRKPDWHFCEQPIDAARQLGEIL